MAKLKDEQRIDIHQNFTLFELFSILSTCFGAIMHEIQSKTPYGKEDIEAYEYYRKIVLNNLDVFQALCRKCQNIQG